MYSRGVGSIRFVSKASYFLLIHNVLFVPGLASNLFASNRFARERRADYTEVLPLCRWVNRHTGATEFTATIRSNDLACLGWTPVRAIESANVSIAELHAESFPLFGPQAPRTKLAARTAPY